jgi:signal transduction histidine kinase
MCRREERKTLAGDPAHGLVFHIVMAEDATVPKRSEIALLAHALQAPLTILRTRLESALEKPWCRDECEKLIRECVNEVRDVNQTVVDLLLLEKSKAGRPAEDPAPFDLAQLITRLSERFEVLATTQGLRFSVEKGDGLMAVADESQVEHLLVNLLDNAFKFTPSGEAVEIEAVQNGPTVVIRVADTGIGIPPEESIRVFESFYQIDVEKSRESRGVGLGLPIARALAEHNGGTLEVESEVGRGSCFVLKLPAK